MDEMKHIVLCKQCGNPEYYGEMYWLSGRCVCRNCYKKEFEKTYKKPYVWTDLDGERPTMEAYKAQEEKANETDC